MNLPPKTVIFLHIPRTGGTTLQRIPERNYGRDRILTFYDFERSAGVERFARLPEPERAKYKFIKGHLYFGFHRFVPGDSAYATFLREPIARASSFYRYACTHSDHYLYRSINEERLSLEALLEREETSELFNLQTRMIAGCVNDPRTSVDRAALERAKENLRTHFCFVGLTEAFDASLLLLARTLGWRMPFYVRRNASGKERRLNNVGDEQINGLLREANALDLELYAFAQELFEAQLRDAGDSMEREFRRFQKLNYLGGHVCESYQNFVHFVQQIVGRRQRATSVTALTQPHRDSTI